MIYKIFLIIFLLYLYPSFANQSNKCAPSFTSKTTISERDNSPYSHGIEYSSRFMASLRGMDKRTRNKKILPIADHPNPEVPLEFLKKLKEEIHNYPSEMKSTKIIFLIEMTKSKHIEVQRFILHELVHLDNKEIPLHAIDKLIILEQAAKNPKLGKEILDKLGSTNSRKKELGGYYEYYEDHYLHHNIVSGRARLHIDKASKVIAIYFHRVMDQLREDTNLTETEINRVMEHYGYPKYGPKYDGPGNIKLISKQTAHLSRLDSMNKIENIVNQAATKKDKLEALIFYAFNSPFTNQPWIAQNLIKLDNTSSKVIQALYQSVNNTLRMIKSYRVDGYVEAYPVKIFNQVMVSIMNASNPDIPLKFLKKFNSRDYNYNEALNILGKAAKSIHIEVQRFALQATNSRTHYKSEDPQRVEKNNAIKLIILEQAAENPNLRQEILDQLESMESIGSRRRNWTISFKQSGYRESVEVHFSNLIFQLRKDNNLSKAQIDRVIEHHDF